MLLPIYDDNVFVLVCRGRAEQTNSHYLNCAGSYKKSAAAVDEVFCVKVPKITSSTLCVCVCVCEDVDVNASISIPRIPFAGVCCVFVMTSPFSAGCLWNSSLMYCLIPAGDSCEKTGIAFSDAEVLSLSLRGSETTVTNSA